MQGHVEDKLLMMIEGRPLFAYSLEAFIESEVVDNLVVVYRDLAQRAVIEGWFRDNCDNIISPLSVLWVQGGERRQDSVVAGLRGISEETDYVFIHDLARPLIQAESIRKMYQTLLIEKAVVLAHAVVDTIKQVGMGSLGVFKDLDRDTLWSMETPQAFAYPLVCRAHEEVARLNLKITDDAAAVSLIGHPIAIVENDRPNPKITLKSDIDYLEFLLRKKYNAAI